MSVNGENSLVPSSYDLLLDGEVVILDDTVGIEPLKSTALASGISGASIISGTKDGTLRDIDFRKWMSGGHGPNWTKSLDQSISSIAISNDEAVIAVASGNVLNFYTDGGDLIVTTTKGDMYLLDAKKTKGHTAMITSVISDLNQFNLFISSSIDGTIRVFDLDSSREGVSLTVNWKKIYLPRAAKGARIPIYSLCNSTINGSSHIIGGTERGGVLIWDYRTANISNYSCSDAHTSTINCLSSPEDSKLISRSDVSIKLWDLRKLKSPLKETAIDGGDVNPQSMVLSPDSSCLAVGEVTPINPRNIKEGFRGAIKILKTDDLSVLESRKLKSPPGPLTWAHDTVQLFTICHDGLLYARCPNNITGALYASRAKESLVKKNKYSSIQNVSAQLESYPIDFLPDNLEETDDGTLRRKRVNKPYDKQGAQREPLTDSVTLGRTPINYDDDDDIVKRLRSMQGEGDVNQAAEYSGIQKIPYKVDKFMAMYKKTQPDVILDFSKPESQGENRLLGVKKCPRCGLKICQCGYMKE